MRINYNVSAMLSNNALANNDSLLAKSLQRLSSGLKINNAKDGPAGLAMAKRMNAQIEGLSVANQNASDGVSVIEIADGAMTEISEMLQRMNELAVKSANGTMSDNDRSTVQDEVAQLKEEITRVANEGGLIFFDASVEGITPAGLMAFSSEYGAAWYLSDEASENRKINADGKGWLAYKNENLLLIKKFQDLKPSEPAPDEAEVQIYVNRGKTYIELESQGAYTELKPGESLDWTVRWYLLQDETPVKPSKALVKKVIKAVK